MRRLIGVVTAFTVAHSLTLDVAASMGSLRAESHDWLLDLATFNLGIEAFQEVLVILLVPVLGWIARHTWSDPVLKTLSFIVMSAGLGWFFSRI